MLHNACVYLMSGKLHRRDPMPPETCRKLTNPANEDHPGLIAASAALFLARLMRKPSRFMRLSAYPPKRINKKICYIRFSA